MELGTKRRTIVLWSICGVLAALGAMLVVIGIAEAEFNLIFGGSVILLLAAVFLLHDLVIRPTGDGAQPSSAEKAAWSMLGLCIGALLVLGQMVAGLYKPGFPAYLMLAAYMAIVPFYPLYRRRWLEHDKRRCEVLEDERDHVFKSKGERWAKRTLELALITMTVIFLVFPQILRDLHNPLQVGGLLLAIILSANAVGEARTALLYWKDRRA